MVQNEIEKYPLPFRERVDTACEVMHEFNTE